jgi:hypothetical protein
MKSAKRGKRTLDVEVTNVSKHGFWLLMGGKEHSPSRPDCWIPRVMQNCENNDSLRLDDVKEKVWEPRYDRSANVAINDRIRLREIPYCLEALSNCRQELVPESGAL